jgi:hypothetical protein
MGCKRDVVRRFTTQVNSDGGADQKGLANRHRSRSPCD